MLCFIVESFDFCVTEGQAEDTFLFTVQVSKVKISYFELEMVCFGPVSTCMHFFALNYLGSVFDYFFSLILILAFHPDFAEFDIFLLDTSSYFGCFIPNAEAVN